MKALKVYCVKCHEHYQAKNYKQKVKGHTLYAIATHDACGTQGWRILGKA